MLIKCIECGKEISDRSVTCPNCGCPTDVSIKELEIEKVNNKDKLFYKCPVCNKEYKEGTLECNVCGYTTVISLLQKNQSSQPQCPKCGSTAITAGQRGYSLLTGFLGSNKTVNRCANCGYTWKPDR